MRADHLRLPMKRRKLTDWKLFRPLRENSSHSAMLSRCSSQSASDVDSIPSNNGSKPLRLGPPPTDKVAGRITNSCGMPLHFPQA